MPTALGIYTNTVSVTGNELDPDLSDNTSSHATTVEPIQTRLSLYQRVSQDPVSLNNLLTYYLDVDNYGSANATGVRLTDTLPANVVFKSATASRGNCNLAGSQIICDLGNLAYDESFDVTVEVTPTALGMITNTAIVLGNESDPDLSDNASVRATTVEPVQARLSLYQSVSQNRVIVGTPLTWTLSIYNGGSADATGVIVTDTLPAGAVFHSATASQGNCSSSGGSVICTLGRLGYARYANITIAAIPTVLGIITNTATVIGNEPDPYWADNTSLRIASIEPFQADLSIYISYSYYHLPVIGRPFDYELVVSNAGLADATNVQLTTTLPSNMFSLFAGDWY
jgi:uncharacterized repeat protein (TIGR01451 family)